MDDKAATHIYKHSKTNCKIAKIKPIQKRFKKKKKPWSIIPFAGCFYMLQITRPQVLRIYSVWASPLKLEAVAEAPLLPRSNHWSKAQLKSVWKDGDNHLHEAVMLLPFIKKGTKNSYRWYHDVLTGTQCRL